MKVTLILILIGAFGTIPKVLLNRLADLEIRGQLDIIIKISQNTEKSPGDLRWVAVTHTLA